MLTRTSRGHDCHHLGLHAVIAPGSAHGRTRPSASVRQAPAPVLTTRTSGAGSNRLVASEGGRVVKVDGTAVPVHVRDGRRSDLGADEARLLDQPSRPDERGRARRRFASRAPSSPPAPIRDAACRSPLRRCGMTPRTAGISTTCAYPLEAGRRHGVHAELRWPHLARDLEVDQG